MSPGRRIKHFFKGYLIYCTLLYAYTVFHTLLLVVGGSLLPPHLLEYHSAVYNIFPSCVKLPYLGPPSGYSKIPKDHFLPWKFEMCYRRTTILTVCVAIHTLRQLHFSVTNTIHQRRGWELKMYSKNSNLFAYFAVHFIKIIQILNHRNSNPY